MFCRRAFTLVEVLIAISLFAVLATFITTLYIDSFRETRRSSIQNQLYEDARFILSRVAQEIRNGMIDYDEYYNQYVVIPSYGSIADLDIPNKLSNFGQNYGRYYSAFFNPGIDNALGFTCNNGGRNDRECTPLRKTLDRNTGSNPYYGKVRGQETSEMENAFCGTVKYNSNGDLDNKGYNPENGPRVCQWSVAPNAKQLGMRDELYLISADASRKTILARERIGGTQDVPVYALSLLRLQGFNTNEDAIFDAFVCASEFSCRGTDDVAGVQLFDNGGVQDLACVGQNIPGELPRHREQELNPPGDLVNDVCDPPSGGFAKDFVPISPLRVNIKNIGFVITPIENPYYAFAESDQVQQPRVTISLTVAPNPQYFSVQEQFVEFTVTQTVASGVRSPVPAPVLAR